MLLAWINLFPNSLYFINGQEYLMRKLIYLDLVYFFFLKILMVVKYFQLTKSEDTQKNLFNLNKSLKVRFQKLLILIFLGSNSIILYVMIYYTRILNDTYRFSLELSYCMTFSYYFSQNISSNHHIRFKKPSGNNLGKPFRSSKSIDEANIHIFELIHSKSD